MSYLAVKALHLIFVICWFAGLFYIGRIFIYYKEAESKSENEKIILQNQFMIMAKRLMYIILWPSVVLTSIFGWIMVFRNPALLDLDWMKVKLVLARPSALVIYLCPDRLFERFIIRMSFFHRLLTGDNLSVNLIMKHTIQSDRGIVSLYRVFHGQIGLYFCK